MVLQGGSTLEENETNDADTFYNSLYGSVLTFSSQLTAFYTLKYKQAYAYLG